MSCAFTPARRMNVGGVGVHPEVVAVGVAIEMEPQPVTTNLDDDNDGEDDDDDDVIGYANHATFNVQGEGSYHIWIHNDLTGNTTSKDPVTNPRMP